jgi:hypothetical protein
MACSSGCWGQAVVPVTCSAIPRDERGLVKTQSTFVQVSIDLLRVANDRRSDSESGEDAALAALMHIHAWGTSRDSRLVSRDASSKMHGMATIAEFQSNDYHLPSATPRTLNSVNQHSPGTTAGRQEADSSLRNWCNRRVLEYIKHATPTDHCSRIDDPHPRSRSLIRL